MIDLTKRVEKKVFISLGSNMGDRERYIREALVMISRIPGVRLDKLSRLMETSAVGRVEQEDYLNQLAIIRTSKGPEELLELFKLIEKRLGRKKRDRWEKREIDMDIIAYQGVLIRTESLCIPHPELSNRLFVLMGLKELDPDYVLEGYDENINSLYIRKEASLNNQKVKVLDKQVNVFSEIS